MKIRLANPEHFSDLLDFLRSRGRIAYLTDGLRAIEVMRSRSGSGAETAELQALIDVWQRDYPDAHPELEPS